MKAVVLFFVLFPVFADAQEVTPEDLLSGKFFNTAMQPLGATEATLYSLGDPYNNHSPGESFHEIPVLGKIDLTGGEARKATGAFRDAMAGSRPGGMTLCFEPHHGLRITAGGHSYDYLLCYTCSGFEVLEDNKTIAMGGAKGSPAVLNALLMSHHIAISPYATVDYIENKQKQEAELEEQAAKDEARWIDAMPESIRPFWREMAQSAVGVDAAVLKPVRDVLTKEFPDTDARILALFSWNGSGAGPWSGFPSYEETAETLLLDFSTADLIAAAQQPNLTQRQIEGAARLFGGWGFSKRVGDLKLLPATLKEVLLEHVRKTAGDNRDKLGRAESAFAAN